MQEEQIAVPTEQQGEQQQTVEQVVLSWPLLLVQEEQVAAQVAAQVAEVAEVAEVAPYPVASFAPVGVGNHQEQSHPLRQAPCVGLAVQPVKVQTRLVFAFQ